VYQPPAIAIGDELDVFTPADLPRDESALTGQTIVVIGLDAPQTSQVTPGSNAVVLP